MRRGFDRGEATRRPSLRYAMGGLIKAVNDHETDTAARFRSYAYAVNRRRTPAPLQRHGAGKASEVGTEPVLEDPEATTKLTGELGRPPLVEEIAKEVNVAPEGVVEMTRLFLNTNVSSPDEPGPSSGGEDEPNVSATKSLQYEAL